MKPKFRAFWLKEKIMTNIDAIYFLEGGIKVEDGCCYSEFIKDGNVVLMQSTGLFDTNGVEVFEGDIVEIIYDWKSFTGVVVYDLGETDFKATNGNEDYGNNFQYLTVGESIEVIGNIHENSEILEEK